MCIQERHLKTSGEKLHLAFGSHPHLICYSVKANSNLAVLNVLAKLGCGFDIVSEGELRRVIASGGDTSQVVFSGVGKKTSEIIFALQQEIRCFNVESLPELERIQRISESMGKKAPIAIRINPDIDPHTHRHIVTGLGSTKFGIALDMAMDVYRHARELSHIEIRGIACHIGSQMTTLQPIRQATECLTELLHRLYRDGICITHLDVGGGLGICYHNEQVPSAQQYVDILLSFIKKYRPSLTCIVEPGRFIAGNSGLLLTRIEYVKKTTFCNCGCSNE